MQEGSRCSLHFAFLTASPISQQASHTHLVTGAKNLNRIANRTRLLVCFLGISTALHCTPCTITHSERPLHEKRQPEWLLMEKNGGIYQ